MITVILAAADTCRAQAYLELSEELEEVVASLEHGQFIPGAEDE